MNLECPGARTAVLMCIIKIQSSYLGWSTTYLLWVSTVKAPDAISRHGHQRASSLWSHTNYVMKQSNRRISHVPPEPCQQKTCGGLFRRILEGDWLNHLTVTVRESQSDWFTTSRATWSQFSASCWCEAVRHCDVLLTSGRENSLALLSALLHMRRCCPSPAASVVYRPAVACFHHTHTHTNKK